MRSPDYFAVNTGCRMKRRFRYDGPRTESLLFSSAVNITIVLVELTMSVCSDLYSHEHSSGLKLEQHRRCSEIFLGGTVRSKFFF